MKHSWQILFVLAALASGYAAETEAVAPSKPYDRNVFKARFARPKSIPFPADNAFSTERAELGKALFFDPRLSRSGTVSCATCHNPSFSWGDGLPLAVGDMMQILGRRTPTILNLAWAETLFWDGRAGSLEEQALGPIAAPGEMNRDLNAMVRSVNSFPGYRDQFARAYPGEPLTPALVGKALATFERTVVSGPAPFDHWIEGKESAIEEAAKRGFDLFNGKANCEKCHTGWAFTDDGFHDIGAYSADPGRGMYLKNLESMQYAFKTPTLRSVARRAPYFHNGSVPTLAAVIDFYDRGGDVHRPSQAPDVKALNLTSTEKQDLLAFLETLTPDDPPMTLPVLPR
jgi:cytochrome c peroxidase